MANTFSNNRISNIVASQLPHFVRNDHAVFVRFMEAYYEYLEQNGKQLQRSKNLREYRDVDLTIDEFSTKLYNTFLKYIPESVLVDKNMLLKHIKDFYRAKGTEKATRFLMRILHNTEIEIYYPKKDILRASDGKWFVQKSIRVADTEIDGVSNTNITGLEKYIGTRITGNTSGSTALVERIDRFYDQATRIDELILSNIDGDFTAGEEVISTFVDGSNIRDISSNIFSGIISSITVIDGGSGYEIGDPVILVSSTGSGACATVASVTTGNIASIQVISAGAGYRSGANVSFTGGGGSGAYGIVEHVLLDNSIHPNSYNLVSSTISLEANTQIGNTQYSNLNHSNANTSIADAVSYWTYANTGPVLTVSLIDTGDSYESVPTITVDANTRIYQMGILGRMEITNPGQEYRIGDVIEITNVYGGYGTGAAANVTNVDASAANAISEIRFMPVTGFLTGGQGYDQLALPTANVITSTGNGAVITVTNILGTGANLTSTTSSIGTIQRIVILNRGAGYTQNTTVDLSGSGDGEATANVTVVEGIYSYPGRYLNDDGHLSSYNFIQDRDYYQNFSYVIRSNKSISQYRQAIKDTIHPAGMKMFGEYLYHNEDLNSETTVCANAISTIIRPKSYNRMGNTVTIAYTSHGLTSNATITLEFISGSNISNGLYLTSNVANTDALVVHTSNTENTSGIVYVGITR